MIHFEEKNEISFENYNKKKKLKLKFINRNGLLRYLGMNQSLLLYRNKQYMHHIMIK